MVEETEQDANSIWDLRDAGTDAVGTMASGGFWVDLAPPEGTLDPVRPRWNRRESARHE